MQKLKNDEARGFIGIKDIINAPGVNKFPTNRTDTNLNPLYTIICILVVIFGHVIGFINGIIQFLNGLITSICDIRFPTGICVTSCKGSKYKIGFKRQEKNLLGVWVNISNTTKGPSWCYDPLVYFTGTNGSRDGGDFDESLGNCSDTKWWYPSQPNDGADTPYYWDGNLPFSGSKVPYGDWSDYVNSNGTSKNNWVEQCGSIGCKRAKLKQNNNSNWRSSIQNCQKCDLGCVCDGVKVFGVCFDFKYKCIFGGLLCKNCKDACGDEDFSCCSCGDSGCPSGCNDSQCGNAGEGCCQGKCCAKIGLIPLKCADEGKELYISLLKSPFAPACNATYVKPFTCINCGGRNTKGIKDWASCVMEPVAVFLRMLKFDFYNDWVGGSLYFPLVKRKYKLKKNKRKFGQIKKDKFCDFDCYLRSGLSLSQINQPDPTYLQHRIRVPVQVPLFPVIEVEGCAARVTLKRSTNWYGTAENDDETYNLNLAVKEFEFIGKNNNNEKCAITFDTYSQFINSMNNAGVNIETPDREVTGEHAKPTYIEVDENWVNIGGHAHHRNICDNTRMVERVEFFKTSLDCNKGCDFCANNPLCISEDDEVFGSIGGDDCPYCDECKPETWVNGYCNQGDCEEGVGPCEPLSCLPDCGSNGVAPCITDNIIEYGHYTQEIKHGLISWNDGEIYYTPYIPKDDVYENNIEYKGNLMLPTTIQELGSSVYCDIDDIPFIMDSLPPTTFNASYEEIKYKTSGDDDYNPTSNPSTAGRLRVIDKFDDKKNISLNLRAYVEFACSKVVCTNITAPVVQSQVGVEIIDKNDIGLEIGSCFVRFDHDDELRNYFCRRFNGYKAQDLSFHHQRPGSVEWENDYNTYPEITLVDGPNIYYQLPSGEIVLSEYNDGDSFIPGDACGYRKYNDNGTPSGTNDYFYGVAPGQTSSFINYPNDDTYQNDDGTINFGITAQGPDGTDEILDEENILLDDPNNGSEDINGIRFNRSQTPYYLYFGLVPGKTALHKTVSRFFADKINATTLEGVGASSTSVNENINNAPNVTNDVENNFSVYKTCLGETLIEKVKPQ
jgi:hypothetical protein